MKRDEDYVTYLSYAISALFLFGFLYLIGAFSK
jgi:hypothetical protein